MAAKNRGQSRSSLALRPAQDSAEDSAHFSPGSLVKVWRSEENWGLPQTQCVDCTQFSGVRYEYFYDTAGRLTQAKTPSSLSEYDYYGWGSRKSLTLPNGVRTTYTYDGLLRLDTMEHRDKQNNLLASFDYEVGRSGKRLAVSEMLGAASVTISYTYDGLGRLTAANRTSGPSSSFTYNVVGNRLSKTVGGVQTTYQYNALDQLTQEVTGGTTTTYSYDSNGNLTSKTTGSQAVNYVYDSRNRLRQMYNGVVAEANLQAEYAYDFQGNRVAKAVSWFSPKWTMGLWE